ncbi:MAG: hypothetical protein QW041_01985 [Candidatus Pacearchaeota archaeon]
MKKQKKRIKKKKIQKLPPEAEPEPKILQKSKYSEEPIIKSRSKYEEEELEE